MGRHLDGRQRRASQVQARAQRHLAALTHPSHPPESLRMKSLVLASALLAAVAGAHAETSTYAVDPTHTFAFWEIGHFGTSTNRGRFPVKEGAVQFDRAGKVGKAEITIDTAAPNSGVGALDKHLASKDFFNAAEFPTAKFVAEKFSFNGDKVAEATGTLTLLGKTNPVTLKASNFNCYQNPMLK